HLYEQRGLEAELGLGAHLDAGLHQLPLAVFGLLEVVLVAGAAADDQMERRVEVELSPAVVPQPLHRAPVLGLKRPLRLEGPVLLLGVPRATLVHLLEIRLTELAPRVRHAVDHGDGDALADALLAEAHHVIEGARADADERGTRLPFHARRDVLAAAFR